MPQNQFIDFVVVEADLENIIMRQTTETFGRCSDPWVCSRCSHLENGALFSYFLLSVSGCCMWITEHCFFSGDDFVRGAMLDSGYGAATVLGFGRISRHFLRRRGLGFGHFSPFSRRMEKYAQSTLRFESLHVLFALGVRTTFLRVNVMVLA